MSLFLSSVGTWMAYRRRKCFDIKMVWNLELSFIHRIVLRKIETSPVMRKCLQQKSNFYCFCMCFNVLSRNFPETPPEPKQIFPNFICKSLLELYRLIIIGTHQSQSLATSFWIELRYVWNVYLAHENVEVNGITILKYIIAFPENSYKKA